MCPSAPSVSSIVVMQDFVIREIPMPHTRALRKRVLRPHQTFAELAEHEPADGFAVGAYYGKELIAVGFVAPDGTPGSWRVRGMATTPEHRGRGAGTAVLAALVTHAAKQGAGRIWCNARVPARSLYERRGFKVCCEEFELPQIGPHYVMENVVLR
jgi:GNAT superfamily N-acetyltransferase